MKIFLATWLEDNQGITLTGSGNTKRLMSYYFLKEAPQEFIQEYVKNGIYNLRGGKDANKKGTTVNSPSNR